MVKLNFQNLKFEIFWVLVTPPLKKPIGISSKPGHFYTKIYQYTTLKWHSKTEGSCYLVHTLKLSVETKFGEKNKNKKVAKK